jgi:hypothetical protein
MLDLGVQTATTMTTAGQPLQERAALPHGAARLVRCGLCIAGDAFLVCLIGLPVNEPRMMLGLFAPHLDRLILAPPLIP